MRKFILIATMVASVFTANAQNATINSKLYDNLFFSVQGGVYEPTIGQNFFSDMRPLVRVEVGKNITPILGFSISADAGINANNGNHKSSAFTPLSAYGTKTAFDFTNVGFNGLINLNNLFHGFKDKSDVVEVVAQAGLGWVHIYGTDWTSGQKNFLAANFGLSVNFNLCDAWQINIRPAIKYNTDQWRLNVNRSDLNLTAGVTYKLKNSNGTHGFKLCNNKYTQAQMDEMNARINAMRTEYNGQLSAKDKTIADLQSQLAAEKAKDKTVIVNKTEVVNQTQLAPVVIFDQGKSVINKAQQPSVQMIATYMKNHPDSKVTIRGYASPEGNAELNQKLSENRAKAVYNMLVNTYKISSDRLKTEGLGATSDVFPENDWNRVCVFLEENQK